MKFKGLPAGLFGEVTDDPLLDMPSPFEVIMQRLTALPIPGTPAANLTDRDRLAIANAAGVPVAFSLDGTMLRMRSKVPFAITDRGDGGYFVASLSAAARARPASWEAACG